MDFDKLTPEARATAIYYFFGRMGGTIHQLAHDTGLSAEDILHKPAGNAPLGGGFSAVRTCDVDWRTDVLAPKHQGDWFFWRDVISGFWVTGALSHELESRMAGPVFRA